MSYFDDISNVNEYIKMCKGYDGRAIIERLKSILSSGSSVLELGMGPGKDLDILNETFKASGSDLSSVFVDRYGKQNPHSDVFLMDAVELKIDRIFDCIYSNKVLHHVKKQELILSLNNQLKLLNPDGIACHSFWHGEKEEQHSGLYFKYYTIKELGALVPDSFEILVIEKYQEMETNDSLLLILRKSAPQ